MHAAPGFMSGEPLLPPRQNVPLVHMAGAVRGSPPAPPEPPDPVDADPSVSAGSRNDRPPQPAAVSTSAETARAKLFIVRFMSCWWPRTSRFFGGDARRDALVPRRLAPGQEVEHRHADGHPPGDLVQNDGPRAVRDRGLDLDAAVDGAGVHHDGVALGQAEAAV